MKRIGALYCEGVQAAILYMNGDINAAKEALDDMPPRDEEELDPVGTLCPPNGLQGQLFWVSTATFYCLFIHTSLDRQGCLMFSIMFLKQEYFFLFFFPFAHSVK